MDAVTRCIQALRANGLMAYRPGVAQGVCKAPYIVVRGGGAYASGMSGSAGIGYRIITLYCFVPRLGGDLEALAARAKSVMRTINDQVKPTYNEGPEMIEEDFDARSQSIEYRVLRATL